MDVQHYIVQQKKYLKLQKGLFVTENGKDCLILPGLGVLHQKLHTKTLPECKKLSNVKSSEVEGEN